MTGTEDVLYTYFDLDYSQIQINSKQPHMFTVFVSKLIANIYYYLNFFFSICLFWDLIDYLFYFAVMLW